MEGILELRLLAGLAMLLYVVAFAYALQALLHRRRYSHGVLVLLVLAGLLIQSLGLYARGLETRACPVGNPFEVLQFITWSLIILYLLTGPIFRMSLMGFFSVGLAIVLSAISFTVPAWDRVEPREILGGNPWLEAHAALATFSYGAFALLAVCSAMYLIQHASLRQKRGQVVFGFLPSIRELEQMNLRLLLSCVLIYTVAVAIGWVYWAARLEDVAALKLVFAIGLWVGYAGVLILRLKHKLHTRRFAWSCVGLFLFALVTLLPVEWNRWDGSVDRAAGDVMSDL